MLAPAAAPNRLINFTPMMLAILCRNGTRRTWVSRDSPTHFLYPLYDASFIQKSFFSTSSLQKKPSPAEDNAPNPSFTTSYLQKSCGLSPEKAAAVSKKVNLRNTEGPDSVIKLLADYGLTTTQISEIIWESPRILKANPQNTYVPKLDHLASMGFSKSDIGKILSARSGFLFFSLDNKFLPNVDFCKNVIGLSDEDIFKILMRSERFFRYPLQTHMGTYIRALRELGMPQPMISLLATWHPSCLLLCRKRFNEVLQEVLDRGYDPKKMTFVNAMAVFSKLTASTRECKMGVFRQWGWSEDEIQSAVKRSPLCLAISEMKPMSVMDFLVNKVGLGSSYVAKTPGIISLSLEKRIIPRCSVIALLESKGLLKKKRALSSLLHMVESCFLEQYVTKYQGEVPELWSVYQGKMDVEFLGSRSMNMKSI